MNKIASARVWDPASNDKGIQRSSAYLFIREIVWLCLYPTSSKVTQLGPTETFSSHDFSLGGKGRACEWVPSFSRSPGHCQRDSILSCTVQSTKLWDERSEERQIRFPALKGCSFCWPCCRFHQEAYPWAAEKVSPVDSPNWCTSTPGNRHVLPTPPPTLQPAPWACSWMQWWEQSLVALVRKLVSTYRKQAWICRPERNRKLELWCHHGKNKKGECQQLACCKEKTYEFKNSNTRGSTKQESVSTLGLRKPQTWSMANVGYLSFQSSYKDYRRRLLLQLWRQQHKIPRNIKIKETWHYRRITIIFQ